MGEFSLTHWVFILVILLLFFGPSRLPQLGQSLGKALRGFKEGLNEKEKEAASNDPNARIEPVKAAEAEKQSQTERDVSQKTDPTKHS
jgi:sec-independent protein translocase protein TatA